MRNKALKTTVVCAVLAATLNCALANSAVSSLNQRNTILSNTGPAAQQTAETPANDHHGVYIQGGVGTILASMQSNTNFDYSAAHGGLGELLAVGYQTGPHFGMEVDMIHVNLSKNIVDSNVDDDYSTSADGYLVAPSIKGLLTIGDHFSIYGKLGIAYAHAFGSSTGTHSSDDPDQDDNTSPSIVLPYTAIGVSYSVSHSIEIGTEYSGFLYGVANAGLLSANLTYHF